MSGASFYNNEEPFTVEEQNEARGPQRNRWGQARRLDFVEFRLLWDGKINRSDLVEFFGVSMPQASADMDQYKSQAHDNVTYDPSEKAYKATPGFTPVRSLGSTDEYFLQLLALQAYGPGQGTSFVGWAPPWALVECPKRNVEPSMLITTLKAIRAGESLEIEYQSLSRPTPLRRWITPTAIANDEFRWHIRAWCHVRNRYSDFNFGRILKIYGAQKREITIPQDDEWETYIDLEIRANPALTDTQRRVAELDYGMTDGVLTMRCRQALLFYLLRRLRLDEDEPAPPQQRQLVLVNRADVFKAAGRSSDYSARPTEGSQN
ncbi:MAG: WYL domain-containing protein [Burkholderiales bacterium]|nr:WYL domain-containing protein [Burkholderiales bacterium]